MTRLKRLIFGLTFLFFITSQAVNAQSSASATGQIFAEVIAAYTATETSALNFGRFSPGPQGGEIILSPQNTVSVLGSIYTGSGVRNAASFYVTGSVDVAFSITLPAGPVVLSHVSSPRTMTVKDWVSVPSPGVGTGMLQNGFQVVYVGATLKVGPLEDNPAGIYTGSYNITFDFN